MTRIAILEAGYPPRSLQPRFGRYPAMFEALLGGEAVERSYDVARGEFPARPEDHGAYLITGSSAGVYDDRPWIEPLRQFLVAAKGKAKLVGICFGHQIMAEAFGGRVEKSAKGWGIGLQEYRLSEHPAWTAGESRVAIPVCHQDQVVQQPSATSLIGGNDFCPIGILAYQDQPAMSVQFHPEFDPAFATALVDLLGDDVGKAESEAARQSLECSNDRRMVAQWIRQFTSEQS
ncbi:MAG TPA: type 1 glutamine amidotransferase [Allosphingosinicella sp.]|nr:type 1 glutamine amidotransferase [Allosphingosinicella sp.]